MVLKESTKIGFYLWKRQQIIESLLKLGAPNSLKY